MVGKTKSGVLKLCRRDVLPTLPDWGIDAPETAHPGKPGQPFGEAAKECLARIVKGRQWIPEIKAKDVYGRTVARLTSGEIDVSAALAAQGCAHAKESKYLPLQLEAKAAQRGLWKLPESERIDPKDWRKRFK